MLAIGLDHDPASAFADWLDALAGAEHGCQVSLLSRRIAPAGDDRVSWRRRVLRHAEELGGRSCDLVLVEGLEALWGVELARMLGRPSIWHLGTREGLDELALALGGGDTTRALVAEAIASASRVVFDSELTRSSYEALNRRDHQRVLPIGISIPRLEGFAENHPRSALRARYGKSAAELIVLLADERGSLQRHVNALLKEVRAEGSCYVLAGSLAVPLSGRGPALARSDVLGMADALVMSADGREVFPRVLLEAMALGVPVAAPGVPGAGEVIGHEQEGIIIDESSPTEVRRALRRFLLDTASRRRLGINAAVKVRRVLDTTRLVERHLELFRETVLLG